MKLFIKLFLIAVTISACSFESDYYNSESGTGGSMARFTINGEHLYAVDNNNLHTFNISNPQEIEYKGKINVGFGIETIFPNNNNLFLGAANGLYIYRIDASGIPSRASYTEHFWGRDPVVVKDNFAYVTIRDGGWWRASNVLQVYNVININNPIRVEEYRMASPKGLSVFEDRLFVCDGDSLKMFKLIKLTMIEQLSAVKVNNPIDVIAKDSTLFVVAQDGFYQFKWNDDAIEEISNVIIKENN